MKPCKSIIYTLAQLSVPLIVTPRTFLLDREPPERRGRGSSQAVQLGVWGVARSSTRLSAPWPGCHSVASPPGSGLPGSATGQPSAGGDGPQDPLLLQAKVGEEVARTSAWALACQRHTGKNPLGIPAEGQRHPHRGKVGTSAPAWYTRRSSEADIIEPQALGSVLPICATFLERMYRRWGG